MSIYMIFLVIFLVYAIAITLAVALADSAKRGDMIWGERLVERGAPTRKDGGPVEHPHVRGDRGTVAPGMQTPRSTSRSDLTVSYVDYVMAVAVAEIWLARDSKRQRELLDFKRAVLNDLAQLPVKENQ